MKSRNGIVDLLEVAYECGFGAPHEAEVRPRGVQITPNLTPMHVALAYILHDPSIIRKCHLFKTVKKCFCPNNCTGNDGRREPTATSHDGFDGMALKFERDGCVLDADLRAVLPSLQMLLKPGMRRERSRALLNRNDAALVH